MKSFFVFFVSVLAAIQCVHSCVDVLRGSTVRVSNKDSYWFDSEGEVVTVNHEGLEDPITLLFTNTDHGGTAYGNFDADDLVDVEEANGGKGKEKGKDKDRVVSKGVHGVP
jgi:hypothetical protein